MLKVQKSEINTREKILQAVKKLLQSGESDISMSLIAKEVNITKSSLYYFFQNKEDLLTAVVFSLFDECEIKIDALETKNISEDKKLLLMMNAVCEIAEKENTLTRFVFQRLFSKDEKILQKIFERREEKKKFFVHIIEMGMKNGVFKKANSDEIAEIFLGMLDFFTLTSAFPLPKGTQNIDKMKISKTLLSLLKT